MTARRTAAALAAAIAIAGCGDDDEPTAPTVPEPPSGSQFQLQTSGDTATAILPSFDAARQICEAIDSGSYAALPPEVREVRLSVFESPKRVACRVPSAPQGG